MKSIPGFVVVVFLLVGVLLLAIGLWFGWSSWADLAQAQRVEGKVVEMVRTESPKGVGSKKVQAISKGPSFAPVVEYQAGGQTFRIRGHLASSPPAYAVGDTVGVLFQADRPADGRIDSFSETWLMPLVLGGGGIVFGLVGLLMLVARRRGMAS
jgi:hypothetical protein